MKTGNDILRPSHPGGFSGYTPGVLQKETGDASGPEGREKCRGLGGPRIRKVSGGAARARPMVASSLWCSMPPQATAPWKMKIRNNPVVAVCTRRHRLPGQRSAKKFKNRRGRRTSRSHLGEPLGRICGCGPEPPRPYFHCFTRAAGALFLFFPFRQIPPVEIKSSTVRCWSPTAGWRSTKKGPHLSGTRGVQVMLPASAGTRQGCKHELIPWPPLCAGFLPLPRTG